MSTRHVLAFQTRPFLLHPKRSFTSSIVQLKQKGHEQPLPLPPHLQQLLPLENINLPNSVKSWEAFTYTAFMLKIQKRNPGVEFTKQLADDALAKFASKVFPSSTWKRVVKQMNGGSATKLGADQAVMRHWKRLQSGSDAYWKGKGGSKE